MTATLTLNSVTLPTAPIGAPNPLPAVAAMPQAPYEASTEGLPDAIAENIRYGQVSSIHPYLLQDQYTRDREAAPMRLAVLENDLMRAEFALDLGGRLVRLLDKTTGRDLVYRNAIFQPANLALRNAWFSGGVEWNIGMRGHWPLTCAPLYAASITAPDGEPVLRMWEYERVRGLIVQIDATLDSAVAALHVRVRVRNPHADETGMYWWTNIAVAQAEGSRVFAPATHAYQTQYDGTLAHVDVASPDVSRPAVAAQAADWFYDLAGEPRPWIAALEPDGTGLGHVSSERLAGRKLFVWGGTTGGRHWQEWLGGSYFEIQGGLATTQYEHLRMPGGATWEWTETFLPLQVDGADAEWATASAAVGEEVRRAADATDALRLDAVADLAPEHLLNVGSPWGALEAALSTRYGTAFESLPGVRFDATAGGDAQYWRGLLGLAATDDPDASTPPPSYVAGRLWDRLLGEAPSSWLTHYHHAVMAHASGDHAQAAAHYEASLRLRRTAWALRGLGQLRLAIGETDAAIADLTDAVSLAPDLAPLALELGEALLTAGRAEEASGFVAALPPAIRDLGRFHVLAVRAALASGADGEARRMLEDEFDVPDIREGELSMSDLWRQAFPDRPVPERYDFSMA
ncbi:DUF5107 domain-containing protein [Microbacterium sp. NPDC089318]